MIRGKDLIAVIASLCMLAGAAVESASVGAPSDAAAYHARCREAATKIPYTVGDWTGRDVPVPPEADALLRPNVVLSREFTNSLTGRVVSVVFVQSEDARHLPPHYPPRCYPLSRGMNAVSTRPRDWSVDGLTVGGIEYEFHGGDYRPGSAVIVQNFVLLPYGLIARDMEPVEKQMRLRDRYYGAAQMELVFDASTPAEARDQAFVELVGAYRPLIDAVLSGGRAKHEQQ